MGLCDLTRSLQTSHTPLKFLDSKKGLQLFGLMDSFHEAFHEDDARSTHCRSESRLTHLSRWGPWQNHPQVLNVSLHYTRIDCFCPPALHWSEGTHYLYWTFKWAFKNFCVCGALSRLCQMLKAKWSTEALFRVCWMFKATLSVGILISVPFYNPETEVSIWQEDSFV